MDKVKSKGQNSEDTTLKITVDLGNQEAVMGWMTRRASGSGR